MRISADSRDWDFRVGALIRTVDGDTFDLRLHRFIDKGFNIHEDFTVAFRFRLAGIDVVETNEVGGSSATRFADDWIKRAIHDDMLRGQTFKSQGLIPDGAFGRWLIDLYRVDTGEHLADVLREAGYEKPE